MELKDRIRELRIKRNLTLSQLAAAMGKSEGAIRSWETGRAKPDADSLVKLSDFFCCTVDYLLGRSDTITSSTKASEVFIYYLQAQMDVLRVEIEEGTERLQSLMSACAEQEDYVNAKHKEWQRLKTEYNKLKSNVDKNSSNPPSEEK